jgi:hypothetical protein
MASAAFPDGGSIAVPDPGRAPHRPALRMSVHEGKPEVIVGGQTDANDPKRKQNGGGIIRAINV